MPTGCLFASFHVFCCVQNVLSLVSGLGAYCAEHDSMVLFKCEILAQMYILALNPFAWQQPGVVCDMTKSDSQSLLVAWSQAS